MSNKDDYLAKEAVITAIASEQIKLPNMPISIFLQEAENLYHWCREDKDPLTQAGLDWSMVADVPVRAGALREAESVWFKERYGKEEAEKEWAEKAPQAYDLRDQLLHALRYAYRNDSALLTRLSNIAAGTGHADMVQDLNDIAVLGQENSAPLTAINLETGLLEQAAATADEMAELLAKVTGDRQDNSAPKIIRDQAFTHLKEAVDEIRKCGQYVFWRNGQRQKGYASEYHRK